MHGEISGTVTTCIYISILVFILFSVTLFTLFAKILLYLSMMCASIAEYTIHEVMIVLLLDSDTV